MLRRLSVLAPVLAIGATTALLIPAGAATAAPPATTAGKTYVALGDSYAAGFGIPTTARTADGTAVAPTGNPVPGCAQTTADYPHLLAASLGLQLTDVTCSGAQTKDFSAPQTVTGGTAPAQLDIFKTVQPDLVTITIGGNDLGFSTIARDCLAVSATGPLIFHQRPNGRPISSCEQYYTDAALPGNGTADNPYDKVDDVATAVGQAVAAVRAAAPAAKVAVIAYPAIAPDTANTPAGGCFNASALPPGAPFPATLPFTDVDVPFLQVLQQQLNTAIGQVAVANGAAYADIYPSSLAHSACQPEATRWVEPLVPDQVVAPGSTNSLHPNVAGTTAMAAALEPVVTALFAPPATTAPPTTTAPTGSGTGSAGPTPAGGGAPLAATGVDVPVSWLLGLATALFVAGGVALRAARPRSARH